MVEQPPPEGAKPPRGLRISYKSVAMILGCAVAISVGYLLLTPRPPLIVIGESMTYGIYIRDAKIGSLTTKITGTALVENVESFVARYSLVVGGTARAGELKFDGDGNLRRAAVAEAENLSLKWRTEVGYSFAEELMRVIVEDNRDPDKYWENDVYIRLTTVIMVPEHVWYLLRFESPHLGYRREFHVNLLPNAVLNVRVALKVVGGETVETPAGRFDCWVLEGENTRLASWPIDKLWVAKKERFVVRAIEWQDDIQLEYILESYK